MLQGSSSPLPQTSWQSPPSYRLSMLQPYVSKRMPFSSVVPIVRGYALPPNSPETRHCLLHQIGSEFLHFLVCHSIDHRTVRSGFRQTRCHHERLGVLRLGRFDRYLFWLTSRSSKTSWQISGGSGRFHLVARRIV